MRKFIVLMTAALVIAGCSKTPEISLIGSSELNLLPEGSPATIWFSTNCPWEAATTADWLEIRPVSGTASNNVHIVVSAGANHDGAPRSAVVTVLAQGAILYVKVNQQPAEPETVAVSEVSMDSFVSINEGESYQLSFIITPEDASDQSVSWASSDASVATVEDGMVTGVAEGEAVITVTTGDGGKTAECNVTVVSDRPVMVDLGLSVLWADRNLGATAPQEYGGYYAWGELEPKSEYSWQTYKWGSADGGWIKYSLEDRRSVLEEADDAAHLRLGDKWRVPTEDEWYELLGTRRPDTEASASYRWERTAVGGQDGWRVTYLGNGNSIFFPQAGKMEGTDLVGAGQAGGYWSSFSEGGEQAESVQLSPIDVDTGSLIKAGGLAIRPVYGDYIHVEKVVLQDYEGQVFVGDRFRLEGQVLPENAFEQNLAWASSDESVITVDSWGEAAAVGAGSATISASSPDNGNSASIVIEVLSK